MRASTFQRTQNSLRLISGDWRMNTGGARLAHQTAMPSGVGSFVQALMERYNGWQTHWSSLDLELRRQPSGMTMSPLYHQVQVHVAPHLNLTVPGETHILHQRSMERVERTLREHLVHYLVARGTRIDAVARQESLTARGFNRVLPPGNGMRSEAVATQDSLTARGSNKAPSPGTRADFPLARPVPTVVRRPVTELVPEDRGFPAETAMPLSGRRPAVVSRTNPPAPASVDVNRLTDQVILAIDRRIVAQRERLGRI